MASAEQSASQGLTSVPIYYRVSLMGACDFQVVQFGRDARDAFDAATRAALYEYGHNPYNGTISTVRDFREFTLPKRMKPSDFEAIVWELENGGFVSEPPIKRKFDYEWERPAYQRLRKLWKKYDALPESAKFMLRQAADSIQKWECCVCVQLPPAEEKEYRERMNLKGKRGHVYLFFGLAAC